MKFRARTHNLALFLLCFGVFSLGKDVFSPQIAVLQGCHMFVGVEQLYEVGSVAETAFFTDLLHGKICGMQQLLGVIDADVGKTSREGNAGFAGDQAGKIAGIDMQFLGDVLQLQRLGKTLFHNAQRIFHIGIFCV